VISVNAQKKIIVDVFPIQRVPVLLQVVNVETIAHAGRTALVVTIVNVNRDSEFNLKWHKFDPSFFARDRPRSR
jgi:hypothetical protein